MGLESRNDKVIQELEKTKVSKAKSWTSELRVVTVEQNIFSSSYYVKTVSHVYIVKLRVQMTPRSFEILVQSGSTLSRSNNTGLKTGPKS